MTIEGAIVDLQNLIDDEGIPFWAKPSLKKIIETVEAEREEHLWIPVTERLPNKEAEYMVTKEHLGSKEREVTTEWWIPHSNNWACFKFGWAIIAWAEKPTPYEGSESDG